MKVILNDVGSLIDATTAAGTINTNSATIETAFDNTLSRDGTSPNQMENSIDMNGHQIVNLPSPYTATSPLRLQDLSTFNGGGTIATMPTAGTTNQVLAKHSNVNYDVEWKNSVTSVGLALPADLTVTNSPVTTTGTLTGDWAVTPTGSGAMVRATSPTLVTPALGTPASGTLTNTTGFPTANLAGLGTGVATFLATPSSANLATAVTGETGTGALVFASSPTLVTPVLGTPTSGTLTNTTGFPTANLAGLGTGVATFLATPTSANLATALTDETGSGANVFATSPTLTTPAITGNTILTSNANADARVYVSNNSAGVSASAGFSASNGTGSIEFGMRGTGQTTYGAMSPNKAFIYGATDFVMVSDGGNIIFASGGSSEKARLSTFGNFSISGAHLTSIPVTLTGTSGSMGTTDSDLIINQSGNFTLTLQSAVTYPGRELYIKTIAAFTVISATSNVVPRIGGAASTAILAAAAGNWVRLKSDGTNWIIMAGS